MLVGPGRLTDLERDWSTSQSAWRTSRPERSPSTSCATAGIDNLRTEVRTVGLGDLPCAPLQAPPRNSPRRDRPLSALMYPSDVEHTQDADVLTDNCLAAETDQLITEGAVVRPQGRSQRAPE